MYCHVTIGSNIAPEQNILKALELLNDAFGKLTVYPRVYTPAVDIESEARFINTAAVFWSGDSKEVIKSRLNLIETTLGRDRKNPRRSLLPRTCDIDIIAFEATPTTKVFASASETYIQAVFNSKDHAALISTVFPQLENGSTTVDLDRRSR